MSVTAYRLYPSSIPSAKSKKERHNFRCVFLFGRSVGIRTRGLMDPNHARYQTSPHPDELYLLYRSLSFLSSISFFLFLPQKICAFLLTKNRVGYNIKIKDDEGKKIGFSFFQRAGGWCKAAETIQWITGPGVGSPKQTRRAAR